MANKPVDFVNPPVSEVVFSVQFEGASIDEVTILSEFWPAVREQFPQLEKHGPVPPFIEQFDVVTPQSAPTFEIMKGAPSLRYWFVSEDNSKVIQLQSDRLTFNWRKVAGDEPYPGFETLMPEFFGLYDNCLKIIAANENTVPKPAWCELTYINPIPVDSNTDKHGELSQVLNFLEPGPVREVLPPVEDTQLQQRFRIVHPETHKPIGRLYVTAVPAFEPADGTRRYVVTLMTRGMVVNHDRESLEQFLEIAHEMIVHGFREVTTKEFHDEWGLKSV